MNGSFFLVRIARENSPERIQDADSVRWIVDIAGSAGDREDRDRLRSALEVDGERITEKVLCLADVINEVADEASRFDERETKD
jgi:hypothetical protein